MHVYFSSNGFLLVSFSLSRCYFSFILHSDIIPLAQDQLAHGGDLLCIF